MPSFQNYNELTQQWEPIETDNLNGVIPKTQTWTSTTNQDTFTILNGSILDSKVMKVYAGGVPQTSFTLVNQTTFKLSEPLEAGVEVLLEWYEVKIPATIGHEKTHEVGGQDELDVTKLKNYKEQVGDKLTTVNEQLADLSKKVPRVNITEYGAKANANYYNSADSKWYEDSAFTKLANDDTQAIKDALAYLASFGTGSVYLRPILEFPRGNILVSSNCLIDDMQMVSWLGQGIDSTTLVYTGTGDMISLGTLPNPVTNYWSGKAQGFQLANMTLRNYGQDNMAVNGVRTVNGIVDNGSGGIRITNVRFKGFKNGFYGKMGTDFSKIEDVFCFNCDVGVYLGAGSQQVELLNVNFQMCNEGLVMERAWQGKMDNCWFIDNYKCDVSVEANTTLRSGLPNLSGTSDDLSWTFSNCWFETGAGFNNNADHQYHIIFKGNNTSALPRGIKIVNPLLLSATTGMGTKDTTKKYSFIRIENGTYFEIEDLLIAGNRIDVVVDILSGYYPNVVQSNTRTMDGYTSVPLWNNQADGCVSYDFRKNTISARTTQAYYQINNVVTGQNVKIQNNGDGTVSFILWDGTAWRERVKFEIGNSRLWLNGNIIGFSTVMPTAGSYTTGDVIENKSPSILGTAGSQYIVSGWKRLTTGSAHVLNTDWVEMRTLTGT